MKLWLQDNDTELYSMYKERILFVTEKTLRNKIYKYMISVSKNCILIDLVRISKYFCQR